MGMCAIGGGYCKAYFYVINLESKEQQKLTSTNLGHSFAPCFINGGTEYVAVGGASGFEIWEIKTQQSVKKLGDANIGCMASTNNILAVGTMKGLLQLWDVRSWEMFHSRKFEGLYAYSLHLTADSK